LFRQERPKSDIHDRLTGWPILFTDPSIVVTQFLVVFGKKHNARSFRNLAFDLGMIDEISAKFKA